MGKLKAQEFNSLMTQTPSVVQAIAKGLGITTAELKAMVDKGEMSSEKMIEGLKKAESYVNGQYAKTTTTISGAMQNLSTATEKWVGEMDNTVGVSSLAATAINGLANNAVINARTILTTCSWVYRSSECGYTGRAVADEKDQPTTDMNKDKCSGCLRGCQLRNNVANFGGFVGVNKLG